MDPSEQPSASAIVQRNFDTLDAALTAWGKYDEYPYKLKAAHEAFRQLVAL